MEKFKCIVVPGKLVSGVRRERQEQILQSWKETWDSFYKKSGFNCRANPEVFFRQDFILSIWSGSRCAGHLFFREINLEFPDPVDLPLIECWSPTSLENVRSQTARPLFSSQIAVTTEFRGRGGEVRDLLIGSGPNVLLSSKYDVMMASVRGDRGVSRQCRLSGARLLQAKAPHQFVKENTDHVFWNRDSAFEGVSQPVQPQISQLLREAEVYRECDLDISWLRHDQDLQVAA